jgi:hypothetical protein
MRTITVPHSVIRTITGPHSVIRTIPVIFHIVTYCVCI